ncbi:MAG: tRNA1(Val) (adenine(37)-N6)-methyltransferase [Levilactobacillus sp.]|uniref:tRNA1(Val) (adenine(37)-N6)-methyltransferase n=1 Tax=Levilactobacillus sp. TaxID=2767919 RepID=UPI00258A9468|nr:tRNA1(Val) (adenine(37)-N6)-methyltransferase [Levilactobacillus sp.]MCH4123215.1 tRNA1(Val) (adenine(37)-N6)-methyltransferase [Levilactobacillus sp.]MCI1552647.1 tRNA1(Val) (adenine(37)-N6)-methyltransferase [Levilactobacillus sp.]MCI1599766.1 tRNA1(Val) (adenine(37)-N6)-methyltransferase [Levilactobacillus sp.]MCI1606388.1 tRNA1(Val) (adenine(37)-N6)-methyltransferase [Levilactobacillus sp.]
MVKVTLKPDERIDQLYSQDIQIIQSPEVFAFSLDAVLLADFAKLPLRASSQTVDLCAGNGAVGLFMSHKTHGHIAEVEIQPRLADMARRSIALNQLDDQMTVYEGDLAQVNQWIPKDSADVVTCNPPYFADLPDSQKNPNRYLAIARHEILTNLATIVATTSGLLKMNGKAYFVHRPDRLFQLLQLMAANRLAPKRIRLVHPKPGKEANMVLVEAIKDGKPGGVRFPAPLTVYDAQGHYTPEVEALLYGHR